MLVVLDREEPDVTRGKKEWPKANPKDRSITFPVILLGDSRSLDKIRSKNGLKAKVDQRQECFPQQRLNCLELSKLDPKNGCYTSYNNVASASTEDVDACYDKPYFYRLIYTSCSKALTSRTLFDTIVSFFVLKR